MYIEHGGMKEPLVKCQEEQDLLKYEEHIIFCTTIAPMSSWLHHVLRSACKHLNFVIIGIYMDSSFRYPKDF